MRRQQDAMRQQEMRRQQDAMRQQKEQMRKQQETMRLQKERMRQEQMRKQQGTQRKQQANLKNKQLHQKQLTDTQQRALQRQQHQQIQRQKDALLKKQAADNAIKLSKQKKQQKISTQKQKDVKDRLKKLERIKKQKDRDKQKKKVAKKKEKDAKNVVLLTNKYSFDPKFWNKGVDVKGRRVYKRNDLFDLKETSSWRENGKVVTGNNIERMRSGRAPIGHDGKSIELHHLTQKESVKFNGTKGSLAEVNSTFHSKYSRRLHIPSPRNPNKPNQTLPKYPSFRTNNDGTISQQGKEFDKYKGVYWKERAIDFIK